MSTKLMFLCILLFSNLSKSFSQVSKIDSSSMKILRIDPQAARGAIVSEIFDEVEFIPLETTPESTFGNINELKVVDGNFVFMDYDTRVVMIFTKQGKFRGKIPASKVLLDQENKDKSRFWSFSIGTENGKNIIQIQTSKFIFYFDLDGQQLMRKPINEVKLKSPFYFADAKFFIERSYSRITGKDTTNYQLAYVRNEKDTTGYFPFKFREKWGAGERIYSSGIPNEYLYYNYYSYDVFRITPSQIFFAYQIVFPSANSIPNDFIDNPLFENKRGEFFTKNKDVYFGLSNVFLLNDNLYLKVNKMSWDKNMNQSIIYNLKTTETIAVEKIEPDPLSYFLPITDAGAFFDFYNYGFQLYDNGSFYTNYSSLAMLSFKEQIKEKQIKFPPVLENYFKTATKKNNSIIIRLKPKKQ